MTSQGAGGTARSDLHFRKSRRQGRIAGMPADCLLAPSATPHPLGAALGPRQLRFPGSCVWLPDSWGPWKALAEAWQGARRGEARVFPLLQPLTAPPLEAAFLHFLRGRKAPEDLSAPALCQPWSHSATSGLWPPHLLPQPGVQAASCRCQSLSFLKPPVGLSALLLQINPLCSIPIFWEHLQWLL